MNPVNPFVRKETLKLFCGFAAVCAGLGLSAGDPQIYWQENYKNYAQTAPGVIAAPWEQISFDNDPIWSLTANINLNLKEKKAVYEKDIALPDLKAADIYFKFRFTNAKDPVPGKPEVKDAKGNVKQKAVAPVPGDPKHFIVRVNDTQVTVASDSVTVNGKTGAAPLVRNWKWEEGCIKVADGKMTVYVSRDRKFEKALEVPFNEKVSRLNFIGDVDNRVSLTDLMVMDGAPLRTYPAQKHFADFRSLTQKFDAPTGQQISVSPKNAGPSGVSFDLKLNTTEKDAALVTLHWADGAIEKYPVSANSVRESVISPVLGYGRGQSFELKDAVIKFGARLSYFIRPDLGRFHSSYSVEPQYYDVVREWDQLPPASTHVLNVRFVSCPDNTVQLFFDGSLVHILKHEMKKADKNAKKEFAALEKVDVSCGPKTQIMVVNRGLVQGLYTIIDFAANPRAKAFADGSISLKPGEQTIQGIPFIVAEPMDSADVAICKQAQGNWALEVDEYHGRSPLDGYPSAIHFRLPAAPYGIAHVIFALDPDPKKDAYLTTRMGYMVHNGSGANMLGDSILDLRSGEFPSNVKQIGMAKIKGRDVPLYLADIQLGTGSIIDILSRKDYVDFEFIGLGWENFQQMDNTMKPHPNSDSSFNIFAVTLETSPVGMDIRQTSPGNVFTEDEKAETFVQLKAMKDNASGTVEWTAKDTDGVGFSGSKTFKLAKTGDMVEIPISFAGARRGCYELDITVKVGDRTVYRHPARFAILPKDIRTADKVKSPYATWWFNSHGSPGAIEIGGPIMQKAGIRKSSWRVANKEEKQKYNVTNIGNLTAFGKIDPATGKFKDVTVKVPDPADPTGKKMIDKKMTGEENWYQTIKKSYDAVTADGGFVNFIMIYHESGPGYGIPEELLGTAFSPDGKPWTKEMIEGKCGKMIEGDKKSIVPFINETGRLVRKYFPDMKIQIGNCSASIGQVVRPLRAGVNPDYYDVIGNESPAQVIPPEKLQECGFQGVMVASDALKTLSNGKNPGRMNACWENTYRADRDMGEQIQAEWYMRDVLISLAHGYTLVSPGILFDCNNGYYNGLWGGSGMLRREPYVYPKRSYVAYAVLTYVLDDVNFIRQIPTGSSTVYALEFKRARDGKTITAMWTARGEAEMTVKNPSGKIKLTDMYGTETVLKNAGKPIPVSTEPVYVETEKPLGPIAISARSFREDSDRFAKNTAVAAFNDVKLLVDAKAQPDPQYESIQHSFLPILKPAEFSVATVQDPEKGSCIAVTLSDKDVYQSRYVTEYTTLRLKEPVTLSGNAKAIGVWVKGNSNWGQIRFEIEDAKGEVFKNISTGPSWGCDIMDWPGNLCVNFDGWCFVGTALFPTMLFPTHSPGPVSDQWVSCGGDKKIDLPIKIRAITIGMNRWKLDLSEFVKSEPTILIRDCAVICE